MKTRSIIASLIAILVMTLLGSSSLPFLSQPVAAARGPTADLLAEIPVEGLLTTGGTFEGLLTVTGMNYDDDTDDLLLSGVLSGTATLPDGSTQTVNHIFTDVAATLSAQDTIGSRSCEIIDLDLGPINLDILGLVVDLSPVDLDIDAVQGPGRLLGNLLCALTGLLDADGPLAFIQRLLDHINRILG